MMEFLRGFGSVLVYIAICLPALLLMRWKAKVPDEVYRKLLHCVLLGITVVWLYAFARWWIAVAACAVIVALIYPILRCAEGIPGFSAFITERKSGELRASATLVFIMLAMVMTVCWGLLGDRLLALTSIFAWGLGDAAAALVGKRFGRHKVNLKAVGGKKSWEGSAAMLVTSFVSVCALLTVRGGLSWPVCAGVSLATAIVSAATELFSKGGYDTITCPLAAMAALIGLLSAAGGL